MMFAASAMDDLDIIERTQRERVVSIAKTWVGTRYHHAARIKRAGVDCLTLLAEVFTEAGLIDKPDIPYYPHDWMLHRDAERYLEGLLKYTTEIKGDPLPGDIVVYKFGRCFAHGAIVVDWPMIIHAHFKCNCIYENAEQAQWLNNVGENEPDKGKLRPRRFFSFWRK